MCMGLLQFRRVKTVLYAMFVEIGRPLLAQGLGNQVAFVKQKNSILIAVHFPDVGLQVLAPKKKWVSGVDYLHQQLTLLDHSPELPPDLNVLLEWG